MDRQTIEHYDRHAAELGARYRSMQDAHRQKHFGEAFPNKGARILDVGSGSGRDVSLLHGLPFGLPLAEDADAGGPFDGILCSAVLMHVPEGDHQHYREAIGLGGGYHVHSQVAALALAIHRAIDSHVSRVQVGPVEATG